MKTFEGDFTYLGETEIEVEQVQPEKPDFDKLDRLTKAIVKGYRHKDLTIDDIQNEASQWTPTTAIGTHGWIKWLSDRSKLAKAVFKHADPPYRVGGKSNQSWVDFPFRQYNKSWAKWYNLSESKWMGPGTAGAFYISRGLYIIGMKPQWANARKEAVKFILKDNEYQVWELQKNKDLIQSLILSNELSLAESKLHLITSEKIKSELIKAIESAKERNRLAEEAKKIEQKKKQRNILLAVLATAGGAYLTMKE